MGKLGDLFKDIFGSGYNNIFKGTLNGHQISDTSYGKAIDSWFSGVTGSALTPAEMAANEFSHNEAQLARDWQEKFYNQYQSPQAMVHQFQEAGINPAVMYGSGPGSSSPVSSSAPSSVSPSASPQALISMLPGLAKLKAEIDNIHEDTLLKRDQARYSRAQSRIAEIHSETEPALRALEVQLKEQGVDLNRLDLEWKPQQYEQAYRRGEIDVEAARVGIAKALTEIQQLQADIVLTTRRGDTELLIQALTSAQTALAQTQEKFVSAQSANEWWIANFRSSTGMSPDLNIWSLVPALANNVSGHVKSFGRKVESLFKRAKDIGRNSRISPTSPPGFRN